MKNKILLFIALTMISLNCYAKVIVNNKVYFDNIKGSDDNNGTSWGQAFKTLKYLTPYSSRSDPEWYASKTIDTNFYIKATNKPYRTTEMILGAGHFYFDSSGYADINGNEVRGSKKAIIFGSLQAIKNDNWPSWYTVKNGWALLSPADSLIKLYSAKSPFSKLSPIMPITRAYIDGYRSQMITQISGIPSDLKNNEYLVTDENDIFYRNDTVHPGDLNIEFIADHEYHIGIEGSFYMWVYGASLRYFRNGFMHGSCKTEEIKNLDVSYSGDIGVVLTSWLAEGTPYHNIISHHNEGDGIHIQGYNNSKLFNSIAHNNKGDGIVLVPQGENIEIPRAYVSNNTSVNNAGYGFRIYTQETWKKIYPSDYRFSSGSNIRNSSWTLYNNISSNNGAGEFNLEDAINSLTFWFNGWYGLNNDLFNIHSGYANVINIVPQFVDANNENFHLKSTSPYIAKGIPSTVRGRIDLNTYEIDGYDIDGNIRSTTAPDIGADEFK